MTSGCTDKALARASMLRSEIMRRKGFRIQALTDCLLSVPRDARTRSAAFHPLWSIWVMSKVWKGVAMQHMVMCRETIGQRERPFTLDFLSSVVIHSWHDETYRRRETCCDPCQHAPFSRMARARSWPLTSAHVEHPDGPHHHAAAKRRGSDRGRRRSNRSIRACRAMTRDEALNAAAEVLARATIALTRPDFTSVRPAKPRRTTPRRPPDACKIPA